MNDLENEYVVGTYGTTYKAIDVFRTGEMQGTHNERLRIIKLLEEYLSAFQAPQEQLMQRRMTDFIALIKGEQK